MAQSKRESLVEAVLGTFIGLLASLVAQYLVFPYFGFHAPLSVHLWILFWFTVLSVVRSYFVRRAFESKAWRKLLNG